MDKVIERIIAEINSKTDWTLDDKIRYAYIELGKNVHLNVEFFYSLYGLIHEDCSLSFEQLKNIYDNIKPTYNVICKDCARMLKMIFDKCNIKSEIKETIEVDHYYLDEGRMDIQHFFNVVEGNDKKQYFLSLVLDIPLIQLGLKTEHFGTNVVYIDDKGNQVYKGEEIINTVLKPEYIENIDNNIGYLSLKFGDENSKANYVNLAFEKLASANRRNKMYYSMVALNQNNEFYNGLINVMSEEKDSLSVNLYDLDENKINEIKKYVCISIKNKIKEEYLFLQAENADFYILLNNKSYLECIKYLGNILKKNNYKSADGQFNLNALITSSTKLFNVLDKIPSCATYLPDELDKLKQMLNLYIYNIAKVYIPKEYRPDAGYIYSNKYLENKLKVLFKEVFDFNNDTAFTHMKVGEKGVIISRVLHALFPELSNDKTIERKKEDPVENRINTCMMYNKKEGLYKLLVNIEATNQDNNIVLIYNFNDGYNYFEKQDISILELKSNVNRYMIFSKKLSIPAEQNIKETIKK
jgi:hypothetical protein